MMTPSVGLVVVAGDGPWWPDLVGYSVGLVLAGPDDSAGGLQEEVGFG